MLWYGMVKVMAMVTVLVHNGHDNRNGNGYCNGNDNRSGNGNPNGDGIGDSNGNIYR